MLESVLFYETPFSAFIFLKTPLCRIQFDCGISRRLVQAIVAKKGMKTRRKLRFNAIPIYRFFHAKFYSSLVQNIHFNLK